MNRLSTGNSRKNNPYWTILGVIFIYRFLHIRIELIEKEYGKNLDCPISINTEENI